MPIKNAKKQEVKPQEKPVPLLPPDALTCSVRQAAKVSGLSVMNLYNLMNSGKLKYTHVGARRLILVSDLKRLIGAR